MGQCYTVILKVKVTDEAGAIKVLHDKLSEFKDAEKTIEHFKELGISADTLEGIIRIFVSGWNGETIIKKKGNFVRYEADFEAGYHYEYTLITMFNELAPYLANNSYITIYPDDGIDHAKAVDGKAVWTK